MPQSETPEISAPLEEGSASINAAAHAYQVAMEENNAAPAPSAASLFQQQQGGDNLGDVVMSDGTPNRPAVRSSNISHKSFS